MDFILESILYIIVRPRIPQNFIRSMFAQTTLSFWIAELTLAKGKFMKKAINEIGATFIILPMFSIFCSGAAVAAKPAPVDGACGTYNGLAFISNPASTISKPLLRICAKGSSKK
jgi:hypothetical protein